ncbi:MAG: MFS transporter [Alphaproteobacteria bacterium]|nr:MFS transporter [Alphaproteobacteria bacterium]
MPFFSASEVRTLLAEPAFRRVWGLGAATGIARWIETLAVGVYTYDATDSAFIVAAMTLLRMLPLAFLGPVVGALTDRIGHKRVLLAGLAGIFVVVAVLTGLAWSGLIEVWHLALGALLGGVYWSIDIPVRRSLLGTVSGPERVAQAMSTDAATNNITRAVGPALGGLLLAVLGLEGALGVSVLLYGAGVLLMAGLVQPAVTMMRATAGLWRDIVEGIHYVRRDRSIVGAFSITIVFNVFAFPYTSMIPVIGRDHLALDSFAVGLLMSAEGTGAFLGALIVIFTARPARYRHIYVFGTCFCLTMIALFGASGQYLLSNLAVMLAGAGAGCFSSMQSTIIFLSAPPEARGRLMGLLSVFIGTGPLGFLHLGWMADRIGATAATSVMALEGLVVLILAVTIWPILRPREG